MYTSTLIVFGIFLSVGIIFSFVLFRQEKENKKSTRFLTSERLLVFIIEIMIAVIGFGITLVITNNNERQMEKEKAIRMLEQTIEFTDKQIASERSYLNMHNNEKIDTAVLQISNIINLDYYNNILSNEAILQNANMNTYGDIMRYLAWIENNDNNAKEANESLVYTYLHRRYSKLKILRDLLAVCCDELRGTITAEEAAKRCKEVKNSQKSDSEGSTTTTTETPTTVPTTATVPATS